MRHEEMMNVSFSTLQIPSIGSEARNDRAHWEGKDTTSVELG